ncbi:MAG: hypothetical protein WDA53_00900 [Bacillota bacterium]
MQQRKINKILSVLLSILILGSITSCGQNTLPGTNEIKDADQTVHNHQSFSTVYELDQIIELHPIKVRLVNTGIISNPLYEKGSDDQKGHLALGLEVGNVSSDLAWFFSEQSEIILNSGEILETDVNTSSDLGGSFPPHRLKKGFLVFPFKDTEPNTIKEYVLKIKAPLNSKQISIGEDLELKINLK